MQAEKGTRVAGYLIDLIPAIFLSLFGFIPILGFMIAGLLLAPYWLLRDITGASLGKRLLGVRVTFKDGTPASLGARVIRNLPLAVGPCLMIIPLLGYVIGAPTTGLIILAEAVLLLAQGERIGDRLAGTTVTKKEPSALSAVA